MNMPLNVVMLCGKFTAGGGRPAYAPRSNHLACERDYLGAPQVLRKMDVRAGMLHRDLHRWLEKGV